MFKSLQRQKLESALAATNDPATITTLSAELSRLGDREDRRRAARRRRKVKAKEAVGPPHDEQGRARFSQYTLDGDGIPGTELPEDFWDTALISIPDWPPQTVEPVKQPLKSARDVLGGTSTPSAYPEAPISQLDAIKPAPDGQTYTRRTFGPPWVSDSPTHHAYTVTDAILYGPTHGPERVASNSWCQADGFSFVVEDDFGRRSMTNEREQRTKRGR